MKLLKTLLFGFATSVSLSSHAALISYTETQSIGNAFQSVVSFQRTASGANGVTGSNSNSVSRSLSFAGFDSSLGRLDSVLLTLDVGLSSAFSISVVPFARPGNSIFISTDLNTTFKTLLDITFGGNTLSTRVSRTLESKNPREQLFIAIGRSKSGSTNQSLSPFSGSYDTSSSEFTNFLSAFTIDLDMTSMYQINQCVATTFVFPSNRCDGRLASSISSTSFATVTYNYEAAQQPTTSVDEPSLLGLLIAGLVVVGFSRRIGIAPIHLRQKSNQSGVIS